MCRRGALTPHSIRKSVLHSDAALRGRPPLHDMIRSGLYEYRLVRDLGLLNPVLAHARPIHLVKWSIGSLAL